MAQDVNKDCKLCFQSTLPYKLDGICVKECPKLYISKDILGEKNLCLLVNSKQTCEEFICENNGECFEDNGDPSCKCQRDYLGLNCQISSSEIKGLSSKLDQQADSLSILDAKQPLSEESLNEIYDIAKMVKNVPELASAALYNSLS